MHDEELVTSFAGERAGELQRSSVQMVADERDLSLQEKLREGTSICKTVTRVGQLGGGVNDQELRSRLLANRKLFASSSSWLDKNEKSLWLKQRTVIVDIRNSRGPTSNNKQQVVIGTHDKNSEVEVAANEVVEKLFDSLNLNQEVDHITSRTLAAEKTRARILARERQQIRQNQQQQERQSRQTQEEEKNRREEDKELAGLNHQVVGSRGDRDREIKRETSVSSGEGKKSITQNLQDSTNIRQSENSNQSAINNQQGGGESRTTSGGTQIRDTKEEEEENDEEEGRGRGKVKNKQAGFGGATAAAAAYKLSRLPYFSYHGKARNVNLLSAAERNRDTQKSKNNQRQVVTSGESSGESSASSSQRSLNSLTSGIPTLTRRFGQSSSTSVGSKGSALGEQEKERKNSGYSNISNIFPSKGTRLKRQVSLRFQEDQAEDSVDRRAARRQQFGSLASDLNDQHTHQVVVSKRSALTSPIGINKRRNSVNSKNRSLSSSQSGNLATADNTTMMRRQNSGYLGGTMTKSGGIVNSQSKFGSGATFRERPGSASGYSLARQHKSPSTSSLLYAGNSTGVSPYARGDQSSLLDPDCPVHGYSASPILGGLSKSSHQLNNSIGQQQQQQPQPELLYENDYPPADGYYLDRRAAGGSSRGLYSPSSPPPAQQVVTRRAPVRGQQQQQQQQQAGAYYNNASRFSLYHSPSSELRSSLAPPNEQLRRILGYQPSVIPRPVHLHPQWAYSRPFIHLQGPRSPSPSGPLDPITGEPLIRPIYEPFNQLQDSQAVRAVDFHPSGEVYAVGSNSRALRICAYPADYELRHFSGSQPFASSNSNPVAASANSNNQVAPPPRVLFKFLQLHRGSIYCVQFNATGQLLATGSNDQTVHIVRYNSTTHSPDGDEYRLTMHDGTIRDLTFIDDPTNGSALLLSAGGGDNKIYVTDCDTITPFQSMAGHTQTVMALHHWAGASFVSASLDKSIRFWDLRTRSCTSIVSAPPSPTSSSIKGAGKWAGPGAPVCSVKVDPSGRLLASGHADATCMLYDIRAARIIQAHKPHDDEIRTLSFSPKSYYLLTGGYDGRILLTDLQGDLTQPLPTCCVAESEDKVVQAKWHPIDFTFVTTSADKTATLWAMPTE